MNKSLCFTISSIDIIDEVNNSLFKKAKIRAFASGENAHTLPVDEQVIRDSAKTIYNKPMLWRYNKYLDDSMGHEKDEVPCGFIPETFNEKENPIYFERDKDGRLFIVIMAYFWTKYSGRLLDIFNRDGNKKDLSIEIVVVESEQINGKDKILKFVISGITILGEWVNPACKGCRAELLSFSEDKRKYEEEMFSKYIEIDNNIIDNNVVNTDERYSIYKPIIMSKNYEELFKETYFLNNSYDKNSSTIDHLYPHHRIVNNKLVLDKKQLEFTFKRMYQKNIINNNIKNHLLKHFNTLGLNCNNFSDFNITEKQYKEYFSNTKDTKLKESVGDEGLDRNEMLYSYFKNFTYSNNEETMEKFTIDEIMEDKVICNDNEFNCKYEIEYSFENNELFVDTDNMKKMGDAYAETATQEKNLETEENNQKEMINNSNSKEFDDDNDNDNKNDNDDDDDDEEDKGEDESTEEMSFEELKTKYTEAQNRISQLEADNEAYMSKINAMSDYEELKKFREDTMAQQKKDEEMAKMNKVMSEIEDKGVKMSKDEKEDLITKFSEFSSIDAWSNYVKASVFDKVNNIDGTFKIGLPFANPNTSTNSVWDNI